MIQVEFAQRAVKILEQEVDVLGLAVGGSWLSRELDAFSDLDLIVVTASSTTHDPTLMLAYADKLGALLSGFTGEHVGEPRLLICLYDAPLLHVDLKFLTPDEFHTRVETPTLLLDKTGELRKILQKSESRFPYPDYQWIEDRFWTWVHYALLKIGRGEYLEAYDFLAYLRSAVVGPLLHIKNGNLPRGVRKVEMQLANADFNQLLSTLPTYEKRALLTSLRNAVTLYRDLRKNLYSDEVKQNNTAERAVMRYFEETEN
jgi:predicted nucleotidyltransferase